MHGPRLALTLASLAFAFSGCPSFDTSTVRPRAEAPKAVAVDEVAIPYDPELPKFVIAVEPFTYSPAVREQFSTTIESADVSSRSSASGKVALEAQEGSLAAALGKGAAGSGNISVSGKSSGDRRTDYHSATRTIEPDKQAIALAARMVSALSGVGNLSVRDYDSYTQRGGAKYSLKLKKGEAGPFLVRALVTEYGTKVEGDSKKANYFPIVRTSDKNEVGVVTLDVAVIDGRDGSIVSSFPVSGTFTSKQKGVKAGIILPVYEREHHAKSLVDQALRVAVNDAAKRIIEALSNRAQ